jgi:arylformamidase
MKISVVFQSKNCSVDLSNPIDISLPITNNEKCAKAWYVPTPIIEPVVIDTWVGSVEKGASVNFNNIHFNPHGNGTHTECVGHISLEKYSVNTELKSFHFFAKLITVTPTFNGHDNFVSYDDISKHLDDLENVKALVIRTTPNNENKKHIQYSNSNPVYIHFEAMQKIVSSGIEHLLIDTPSVDKEKDEGVLAAHHVFWNYPETKGNNKTITELIYVDNKIEDAFYFLNLQIASFENDASPSKPTLYKLEKL